MHQSEEVVPPSATVTTSCRPAVNVDGWYATMCLWIDGEIAASCDVLVYGEKVPPHAAEELVWRIRQCLVAPALI